MSLDLHALTVGPSDADCPIECEEAGLRLSQFRRKVLVSVVGTILVSGLLVYAVGGHASQFGHALAKAPVHLVVLAIVLQIVALLSRSEAWLICIRAAGATCGRRILFRAAAVGYVASVINGSLGMAARITSLRRSAPDTTPRVPALIAAEIPIITVEVALAAIFSFTLIAPLGVPWWVPVIIVALTGCAVAGLRKLSQRRQNGFWNGLAILHVEGHWRLIAFAVTAVVTQVLRNWLMLHAIGVDISVFDSMALIIVMFTVGQLPIGPSTGPAAAVLVLGSHGVAATAAAGVLLTCTGVIGSLCYAGWAVIDRILAGRNHVAAPAAPVVAVAPVAAVVAPS